MFVVDTSTLETLATINTGTTSGGSPKRMTMDKLGKKLYYASETDATVTIINVADYTVAGTIDFVAGERPHGVVAY
jgi:YVTN family beta-propeller protein